MREIKVEELNFNPFTMIGKKWCLIGAEYENKFNAMTASWGGVGVLWNKNVVTIYVRPQRYTREFIEAQDHFTLSFFDEKYKKELGSIYGRKSGRDINKEEESGFHSVMKDGFSFIEEAELVICCRKIYRGKIHPEEMLDETIESHYPEKDYHYVYIGEIEKVWQKGE